MKHKELKIKWNKTMFSKLTIVEGRNPYHGGNFVLTRYHMRCDPYLGIR